MRITLSLVLVLFFAASITRADYDPTTKPTEVTTINITWHDAGRDRDVPVKIYYPKESTGKLPIIIFSHGLGGSREGYSYLGNCWASHGYVSVHLTHKGSDTEAVLANGLAGVKEASQAIAVKPLIALDRCKDVSFAIDQLTAAETDDSSPLKGKLDLDKIGMAGHSFGANTTMLVSGEQSRSGKSYADKRIKCAIAMSPPIATPEAMWDRVYSSVKIPLFVMTGTLDDSPIGETKAAERRVPFDHVQNIPAYLITFTGGDHMVFSGRKVAGRDKTSDDRIHDLILQGTTAYWDAYLRGDDTAKQWLKENYSKTVGDGGVFEQK